MSNTFAPDYVDVATRLTEFRTKHPEGSLQPADPSSPFTTVTIGGDNFIAVVAAAYRSPDDARPGIGMAYEPYPGKTPYTRGSELQNAETSAWGRAIMAALAADSRRGIASADEVRNRQADRAAPPEPDFDPAPYEQQIDACTNKTELAAVATQLNVVRMPEDAHQLLLSRYRMRQAELDPPEVPA